MVFASDILRGDAGKFESLKTVFAEIRETLRVKAAKRAVYMDTQRELSVLTDRDLADLGINRYDIPRIARDAANAL